MKTRIIITIVTALCFGIGLQAQDVKQKLDEAQASYKTGDLENTRFALQQALHSINMAIGQEIVAMMPATLGGMAKVDTTNNITGVGIYAGIFVNVYYRAADKNASVEIISDSPLIAGINAMMTLPVFMSGDPNQKRIKVENYKALLTKNTSAEGIIDYTVQLPFSSSMLVFKCVGFPEENDVVSMMEDLQVSKIIKAAE